MIAFMIGVFVLWLIWRWLCRSTYVEIAPPPPTTVNVLTPSIVIHVYLPNGRIARQCKGQSVPRLKGQFNARSPA
jgi:hypothetical protein